MKKFMNSFSFLCSMLIIGAITPQTSFARQKVYLSIDSGALMGIAPARLIERLEQQTGKPIHQLVDGIAGTSTGAIIGALATVPGKNGKVASGSEIVSFYQKQGAEVFKGFDARNIFAAIAVVMAPGEEGKTLIATRLYRELIAHFGQAHISEAKAPLSILSYEIASQPANNRFYFFNSEEAKALADKNTSIASAVLASSSVEKIVTPFFPIPLFGQASVQFDSGRTGKFIDPGTSTVPGASCSAKMHFYNQIARTIPQNTAPEDGAVIYVLGTGFSSACANAASLTHPAVKMVELHPRLDDIEALKPFLTVDRNILAADSSFLDAYSQAAEKLMETEAFADLLISLLDR